MNRPAARVYTKRYLRMIRLVAAGGLVLSACSSQARPDASPSFSSRSGAPLPATAPRLLMIDGALGWAVWPSADSWLLLHTTDGWKHVANRTPIAVPTGGGLVATATANSVVVAVGAYQRLTRSPLLTSTEKTSNWKAAELPGAVSDARDAVSYVAGRTSVVLAGAGGTVVRGNGEEWTRLADASGLSPGGNLRLDSVTWADGGLGWLTGHGRAGTPMAFQTTDAGRTWVPLAMATGGAVAALAPCGAGQTWLFPVIAGGGTVTVERTTDGGRSWTSGAAVHLGSGSPARGCRGNRVWLLGRSGHAEHVFASTDGGHSWVNAGAAPPGLTDLSPTGHGAGFATSITSRGPKLWSVTGDGARFTLLALPSWVATVGAQMGTS